MQESKLENTIQESKFTNWQKYAAPIFLVALILFNTIFTSNFLRINTVNNVITQSAVTILVSMGMTLVISTGGIDISVGSLMALTGVITASLMGEIGLFGSIAIGVAASLALGVINGFLVGKMRLQAMVVTLGMMLTARGLAQVVTNGRDIYFNQLGQAGSTLSAFGSYRIGGIVPVQIIPIIIAVLVVWLIVEKMTLGRKIEATGDNLTASKMTGINANLIMIVVYVLSAMFAGFAGILEMSRVSVASGGALGQLAELDAIAAVAIGGTPLSGGKANVFGTVIGAIIMQLITLTAVMNNVPEEYAQIMKAVILILAVYIQRKK